MFLIFLKSRWLSTAAHLLILSSAFSFILTKLQNYSLCEFLIRFFEVPKSGKTTTTKKIDNKSLKKHHRYIYRLYQDSRPAPPPHPPPTASRPTKVTANLKSYNIQSKNIQCKNIQSKIKHKIKYFQLL